MDLDVIKWIYDIIRSTGIPYPFYLDAVFMLMIAFLWKHIRNWKQLSDVMRNYILIQFVGLLVSIFMTVMAIRHPGKF